MKQSELLKKLRKERHFSQEKLSSGISHRSTLSSFENRDTKLCSETLFKYLDRLNIKFSEFEFYLHESQPTLKSKLSKQFVDILSKNQSSKTYEELNDYLTLKYKKTNNYYYYLLQIQLKIVYDKKNDRLNLKDYRNEIKYVSELLFNIETWGYFELTTFNNLMFIFDDQAILNLFKNTYKRMKVFYSNQIYQRLLSTFLINGCYLGFERNNLQLITLFLTHLKEVTRDPINIYEIIHVNIFEILIQKFSGTNVEFHKINIYLDIFCTIGDFEKANELKLFCQKFLAE